MVVTHRYYESKILFHVAVHNAKHLEAPLLAGGQLPALVSLVFSAVAVEGFLNEVTEMARGFADLQPEASLFAQCMSDAADAHASLDTKFVLANWVLTGKRLNRGVPPYQDLAHLVHLRNRLMHFKGNKQYEQDATPEQVHDDLIKRFKGRNLLAKDMEPGSWLHAIETKAIALWSCRTAAEVIVDFVSRIPQGVWQSFVHGIHTDFKAYVSP